MYSRLSKFNIDRGSSSGLVTVGPAKLASWLSARVLGLELEGPELKSRQF